jgi:glycosyltransferase involved in cell wall biosynthesis
VDIYRLAVPKVSRDSLLSQLAYALLFLVKAVAKVLFLQTRVILCITSPPLLFYALSFVCRLRRIPLVLWAMDLYPETFVGAGLIKPGGLMQRTLKNMATTGYKRCARIFTLGPVMTRRIADQGVSEKKLIAVHNWVPESLQYIPGDQNPFINENGLEEKFVVQYSGNMGLVHSFHIIQQAAKELAHSQPDVMFLLIGGGPKREELEHFVARNGLTNVKIMDYVPIEGLSQSISAADVTVVSILGGMEGVIAPGKLYAFLKLGAPFVLVEEKRSDLSRILESDVEGISLRADDTDGFIRYMRELKSDPDRLAKGRWKNAAWYHRNCSLGATAGAFLDELSRLAGQLAAED